MKGVGNFFLFCLPYISASNYQIFKFFVSWDSSLAIDYMILWVDYQMIAEWCSILKVTDSCLLGEAETQPRPGNILHTF